MKCTLRWSENCMKNMFFNFKTISKRGGCWSFFLWNIINLLLWWRVIVVWSRIEINWFAWHHFNFIDGRRRRPMQGLMVNQFLLGSERIRKDCRVGGIFKKFIDFLMMRTLFGEVITSTYKARKFFLSLMFGVNIRVMCFINFLLVLKFLAFIISFLMSSRRLWGLNRIHFGWNNRRGSSFGFWNGLTRRYGWLVLIFQEFGHQLCLNRNKNTIRRWLCWRSWRIWGRKRSVRN